MSLEEDYGWWAWLESKTEVEVVGEGADFQFGVTFKETKEGIVIQRWHADFAKNSGEDDNGTPKDSIGEPRLLFPTGWKLSDFTGDEPLQKRTGDQLTKTEFIKIAQALLEPYFYMSDEELDTCKQTAVSV